jgi:hypothetical protein
VYTFKTGTDEMGWLKMHLTQDCTNGMSKVCRTKN